MSIKEPSFFGNWAATSCDKPEKCSRSDHHDDINHFKTFWFDAAKNGDRETEYDTDIKDITTDDVADHKFVFVSSRCSDGGDKFWERGAEGDDGECDDAIRNSHDAGER